MRTEEYCNRVKLIRKLFIPTCLDVFCNLHPVKKVEGTQVLPTIRFYVIILPLLYEEQRFSFGGQLQH